MLIISVRDNEITDERERQKPKTESNKGVKQAIVKL